MMSYRLSLKLAFLWRAFFSTIAACVVCAASAVVFAASASISAVLETKALGQTPPLGWSSWNYFAADINETLFRDMADAMLSSGLAAAGFEYINVDAGYLVKERAEDGSLVVNERLFPSGIRALADYVHERGLKLGVYTDLTAHSCGPGPGSFGHYIQDATLMAHNWTVDYLKVDYCGTDVDRSPQPQLEAWEALRDALNETGRPIYFSICPHAVAPSTGPAKPYNGGSVYAPPLQWTAAERKHVANSLLVEFTNTFDLWYADPVPAGDGGPISAPGGLITNIDAMMQMTNLSFSGPSSWNDADMLQICTFGEGATRHFNSTGRPGNYGPNSGGMTLREYESHYAIWAIWGSPLIHGADLRTVGQRHPECLELMLNRELLAVNQDPVGAPAKLLYVRTNSSAAFRRGNSLDVNSTQIVQQAWSRPLSQGRAAVVLFNRAEAPANMSVLLSVAGFASNETAAAVRDVLRHEDLPAVQLQITAEVQPHGVEFFVLTPIPKLVL